MVIVFAVEWRAEIYTRAPTGYCRIWRCQPVDDFLHHCHYAQQTERVRPCCRQLSHIFPASFFSVTSFSGLDCHFSPNFSKKPRAVIFVLAALSLPFCKPKLNVISWHPRIIAWSNFFYFFEWSIFWISPVDCWYRVSVWTSGEAF